MTDNMTDNMTMWNRVMFCNPFDSLGIKYSQAKYSDGSIKQKAFFEYGSHESNSIPLEKRIEILAKFVFEGYDMHKLVNDYLDDKDALEDDIRKHNIAWTFYCYSTILVDNFLDKLKEIEPISDNLKRLVRKFYNKDKNKLHKSETSSEEMQRRINEFVNLAKEINYIKRKGVNHD